MALGEITSASLTRAYLDRIAAVDRGDPDLRRIALLRMEGHSVEDVAGAVGCAPRSVKRKLQLIRSIWEREADDVSP